jgi:hypothetical protein
LAAKESNKEKTPKKPTSAFLSLIPQVQRADKKAEVRTFLGFAAAPSSTRFYKSIRLNLTRKFIGKNSSEYLQNIYSLAWEGKPKMRANL